MEGARRVIAGAAIGIAATWAVATLLDGCIKRKGGTTNQPPKHLKDAPLSEALTPEMEEAALLAWRKKYRGYRRGEERGAAGEANGLLKRGKKSQSVSNLSNLALSDFEQPADDTDDSAASAAAAAKSSPDQTSDIENVTFGFYDQRNGSWESLERADPSSALTAYRRAYRAHRMGAASGAKGELSGLPAGTGSPRRRGRKGLAADDQEETATDHHPDSRQREEEAAYRAAIAADPGNNDAHYNLGALLSRRAVRLEKEGGDRYTVAELYEECAQLWGVSQGVESNEARSAQVKAGRARAGKLLPTSDCCLGHGLVNGAAMDGWSCDACGSMLDTGMPASFCEPCGYVVCPRCRRRSSRTRTEGTR